MGLESSRRHGHTRRTCTVNSLKTSDSPPLTIKKSPNQYDISVLTSARQKIYSCTTLLHGNVQPRQERLSYTVHRGTSEEPAVQPIRSRQTYGVNETRRHSRQCSTNRWANYNTCYTSRLMGWATHYIAKLQEGETVQFRPRGNSMSGRIESGQLCTVEPIADASGLSVDDIVLCKVNGYQYIHLIKAIQGSRFHWIQTQKGPAVMRFGDNLVDLLPPNLPQPIAFVDDHLLCFAPDDSKTLQWHALCDL